MEMLCLKKPNKEELEYRKHLLEDPNTMNYNAGFEVSYDGYNYDDGTISFPEERWDDWYDKQDDKSFYAYVVRNEDNTYVGSVNYHYDKTNNRYDVGVIIEGKYRNLGYSKKALSLLCKHAFDNGINKLYDNFECSRKKANKIFFDLGFKVVKEEKYIRFKKEVDGYLICLERSDFNEYK